MFKRPIDELTTDVLVINLFQLASSGQYSTPDALLQAAQEQMPDESRERIIAAAAYMSELLAQGSSPVRAGMIPDFLEQFAELPMPKYDGPEPSEFEVQRIKKHLEEGRFKELSKTHQDWICCRLMPSLTRYGVYPPPSGAGDRVSKSAINFNGECL